MEFTVKQVADMFCVNPETVRRWIRQGYLAATKHSRKDGNVITKQAIDIFCRKHPQYLRYKEDIATETIYEIRFLDKATYNVSSMHFKTLDELYSYVRQRPNLVIVDILPEIGA